MAQPARPYPTPDSKSPCQGLSESVVGFSGGAHFTRLDSGEQCPVPQETEQLELVSFLYTEIM